MSYHRPGDVARLTGVPTTTLHHWRKRGLIRPLRSTGGGHLRYSDDDVRRVRVAQSMLDAGLSTQRMTTLLPHVEQFHREHLGGNVALLPRLVRLLLIAHRPRGTHARG